MPHSRRRGAGLCQYALRTLIWMPESLPGRSESGGHCHVLEILKRIYLDFQQQTDTLACRTASDSVDRLDWRQSVTPMVNQVGEHVTKSKP